APHAQAHQRVLRYEQPQSFEEDRREKRRAETCSNDTHCDSGIYRPRSKQGEETMTQPMPANILTIPGKKPPRARRGKMDFLTPIELLSVLRVAREHSTRTWAMILIAYSHGLRASEVCGLKLADINLKDATIAVRRLKGSLATVQMLM